MEQEAERKVTGRAREVEAAKNKIVERKSKRNKQSNARRKKTEKMLGTKYLRSSFYF